MSDEPLPAELERRIQELEQPENQGAGFRGVDWLLLALTGPNTPNMANQPRGS